LLRIVSSLEAAYGRLVVLTYDLQGHL
jgi:hypothetical protein